MKAVFVDHVRGGNWRNLVFQDQNVSCCVLFVLNCFGSVYLHCMCLYFTFNSINPNIQLRLSKFSIIFV